MYYWQSQTAIHVASASLDSKSAALKSKNMLRIIIYKSRAQKYINKIEADGNNCIVFENCTASIVDFMVANIRLLAPLERRQ